MDIAPLWLIERRRLIALRFAARLTGAWVDYPGLNDWRRESVWANRLAFARFLVLEHYLTEWPTESSSTGPASSSSPPSPRRS